LYGFGQVISLKVDRTSGLNGAGGVFRGGSRTVRTCPITAARRLALLTQRWAALQHITADPDRTTEITRAALVLTQFEHKYIS
jgi:hypothetical protein